MGFDAWHCAAGSQQVMLPLSAQISQGFSILFIDGKENQWGVLLGQRDFTVALHHRETP